MTKNLFAEGSDFDIDYRRLLWAVDVLCGDNPQSDSIADHGWVDSDMRRDQLLPPPVFEDGQKGMSKKALAEKHSLPILASRLRNAVDESGDILNDVRAGVLRREIEIADIRIREALAGEVDRVVKPDFKEMWKAITGAAPPTIASLMPEIAALRDHLLMQLSHLGVKVTNQRTLRGNFQQWMARHVQYGLNDQDQIRTIIARRVAEFFEQFRTFAKRVPSLVPFAKQLSVSEYSLKVLPDMNFDAGLSYFGRERDGRPILSANFEWNAGRPASRVDIEYIACHEATHYFNTSLMDLQRRAGLLGPEASLLTMSSCRAMNEEGLAQVILELLHGGLHRVGEDLGGEMVVEILLDQLQDIARLVAAVGWNVDYAFLPEEARQPVLHAFIRDVLLQSDHIAHKYMGPHKKFWRSLPGGVMYAPAYYYGSRAYRRALLNHDAEKVFEVGTHARGLVDLQAFQQLLVFQQ